jgi:hypothetical protein
MKKLHFTIAILSILGSITLLNCSKEKDKNLVKIAVNPLNLDTISFDRSMKGWELYSWPNGNDWNYSILPGTNILKSYKQVTSNKIIVFGKDSLKMLLDRFPKNEDIFWISEEWLKKIWHNNYGTLSLPDNQIVNEIMDYCNQKELVLNVSK